MDIIRFIKDWTLPVAMGMGAALYLLFAFVPCLDEAARFFDPIMEAILPLFMFLVLFVTFCKVDFHQYTRILSAIPAVFQIGWQCIVDNVIAAKCLYRINALCPIIKP